jgi:hypothetical protein
LAPVPRQQRGEIGALVIGDAGEYFIDRQTVVDVVPVVWCDVGRIDAERLNGVDQLQHALDPGPAYRASLIADFARARAEPLGSFFEYS